ncbi:MAG: hypothetical protein IAE95_13705 [Chitinophagaceae bacterium]|nr:hypothetical protein [Chitinophagaceae bacterium]
MKKHFLLLAGAAVILASCGGENKTEDAGQTQAQVDSAVNAGFVWILFFSILLVRERRIDFALILGLIGGVALLAKSSSRMFLAIAALAPVLLIGEKPRSLVSKTINYWLLLGAAIFMSLIFYNVQRLSPYFHYVELKNTTFVMTLGEFLMTPFAYVHNFGYIPLYIAWESGWVIIVPAMLGLILLFRKDVKLAVYLSFFLIAPYIAIGFFAKILFPRYILFYSTLVVIFAVYYLLQIKKQYNMIAALFALLFSMSVLNYALLFDPAKAFFPPVDRGQYVEGATAVWGARDLMKYLQDQAKTKPVLVLAEGDFGLAADVLKVFNYDGDNVEVKGFWPLEEATLLEYQTELLSRDVYVVFSHREDFPPHWPIELVEEYRKPAGNEILYLFRLRGETAVASLRAQ